MKVEILDGKWAIGIEKDWYNDWEMKLYRFTEGYGFLTREMKKISGLNYSAIPFWFKPMEQRIETVTKRFFEEAKRIEKEEYEKEHAEEILTNKIKDALKKLESGKYA